LGALSGCFSYPASLRIDDPIEDHVFTALANDSSCQMGTRVWVMQILRERRSRQMPSLSHIVFRPWPLAPGLVSGGSFPLLEPIAILHRSRSGSSGPPEISSFGLDHRKGREEPQFIIDARNLHHRHSIICGKCIWSSPLARRAVEMMLGWERHRIKLTSAPLTKFLALTFDTVFIRSP
jgi:hypothetical protein